MNGGKRGDRRRERLLSTGEAARALGIDRTTLSRYALDGTVTPTWRTPGGHARWDLDDLKHQLGIEEQSRD